MLFVFVVMGVVTLLALRIGWDCCPFGRTVLILGRECEGVGRGRLSGGDDVEGVIGTLGENAFHPGTAPILMTVPFVIPGAFGRAFFPLAIPDSGVIGELTFEAGGMGGRSASFFGLLGPLNEGPAGGTIGLLG
jgi:hypothetical protein